MRTNTLTVCQTSALTELRRRGSLRPTARAFAGPNGERTFQRRTLQALVDNGFAEWRPGVRGTRNGPVTYDAFITPSTEHALEQFFAVWADHYLLCDLGEKLTCTEAEALAALFRSQGRAGSADTLISAHALGDDEGDDHWVDDEVEDHIGPCSSPCTADNCEETRNA